MQLGCSNVAVSFCWWRHHVLRAANKACIADEPAEHRIGHAGHGRKDCGGRNVDIANLKRVRHLRALRGDNVIGRIFPELLHCLCPGASEGTLPIFDTALVQELNQAPIVADLKCSQVKGVSRYARDFTPTAKPPPQRRPVKTLSRYCLAAAFLAASALLASDFAYFRRKRSTRPAVSTSFCLPVKNGWHFEQISRWISGLVERALKVSPQAHLTIASTYLGWMFAFIEPPVRRPIISGNPKLATGVLDGPAGNSSERDFRGGFPD